MCGEKPCVLSIEVSTLVVPGAPGPLRKSLRELLFRLLPDDPLNDLVDVCGPHSTDGNHYPRIFRHVIQVQLADELSGREDTECT